MSAFDPLRTLRFIATPWPWNRRLTALPMIGSRAPRYKNVNRIPDDVFERGSRLYDLSSEQPELAWDAIRSLIARFDEIDLFTDERTEARRILAELAAGPLENLLAEHGPQFIDRVEVEARRDRRVFWTLGCVWKNSMTDDVWDRVQRAAGGMSR